MVYLGIYKHIMTSN